MDFHRPKLNQTLVHIRTFCIHSAVFTECSPPSHKRRATHASLSRRRRRRRQTPLGCGRGAVRSDRTRWNLQSPDAADPFTWAKQSFFAPQTPTQPQPQPLQQNSCIINSNVRSSSFCFRPLAIAQGAGVVQENSEHPTRKDDPRTASTSPAGRRKTTRDSAVPSGQLRGPSAYEESAGALSRPQFMSLCIARLVSHFYCRSRQPAQLAVRFLPLPHPPRVRKQPSLLPTRPPFPKPANMFHP